MTDDDSEKATAPEEATPPVPPGEQTDGEGDTDGDAPGERGDARTDEHQFSGGQGFGDPYGEGFDLDPPELSVDAGTVDPVDSRVVADTLDDRQVGADQVDTEQLLDVGLSYMQINRHEQAADAFERVARFADDDRLEQEGWVNKGVAHAELEEWDPAIGAYREALRVDGDSDHAASAHTNLAYALYESGQGEKALEHAEKAVELDPRFGQAWYNRGFFLLERGLAEDAVNAFDNALRLGFRNAEILEEKARALDELGQYDRAEEVASEAEALRERAEQELVEEHGRGGAGGDAGPGGGADAGGRAGGDRGPSGPEGGLAEDLAEEFAGMGSEGGADADTGDEHERERLDE
ncbi:MAG: tetratricopeptide repeat protein [Haloglomus sp.]